MIQVNEIFDWKIDKNFKFIKYETKNKFKGKIKFLKIGIKKELSHTKYAKQTYHKQWLDQLGPVWH